MRYILADLDIAKPLPALDIAPGISGVGLLIRYQERPLAFLMIPLNTRVISSNELQTLIMERAGTAIAAESIRRELNSEAVSAAKLPSLTVAICTKDHPQLLVRAIRSLLPFAAELHDQNGCEIMVIDNAPSDERTRQIVESFPRVRYVREPRVGLDFARNRAIRECATELLAFLDDDAVADRRWSSGLRRTWAENPDAAAFTGPVLPYELETSAQILFEARGGFGAKFEARRFKALCPEIRNYPCAADCFGTGCNMVFRRKVLLELGGFDEALDTGKPLPAGGDLDIFYRIVRGGFVLVKEPELLVWHQHRQELKQLRHQMYTWGLGTMAYASKNYRSDKLNRNRFRWTILVWFRSILRLALSSGLEQRGWSRDLARAELWGGIVGICGAYDWSKLRVDKIRKRFA